MYMVYHGDWSIVKYAAAVTAQSSAELLFDQKFRRP